MAVAAGNGGDGPEEGVGESSSPPRDPAPAPVPAPAASGGSGGGVRGGGLRDICREVFERLVNDGHPAGSELLAQLEAPFNRLPMSHKLDVNIDKAEDVLIHQKVLAEAKDPDRHPAFAVRFLRLEEVNVDETTNSDAHEEGADIGEALSTRDNGCMLEVSRTKGFPLSTSKNPNSVLPSPSMMQNIHKVTKVLPDFNPDTKDALINNTRRMALQPLKICDEDEDDSGNEFLSSAKLPKSGNCTTHIDVELVPKNSKKFCFDNLDDGCLLDVSGTKGSLLSTSKNPNSVLPSPSMMQKIHKVFSDEEIEDILSQWINNPHYLLPSNVYSIDIYTKKCFEELEQYSTDGVAYFVLHLKHVWNGFNRKMANNLYSWKQANVYTRERSILKIMKYAEGKTYVRYRCMKEYTMKDGPENIVFCEISSHEWRDGRKDQKDLGAQDPGAHDPGAHGLSDIRRKDLGAHAPALETEVENLRRQLQQVMHDRNMFERKVKNNQEELENLKSEVEQLREDGNHLKSEVEQLREDGNLFESTYLSQRERIEALELEVASLNEKLKRSDLTNMKSMSECEKQKRMMHDMELQIEAGEKLRKELQNTIIELKGNVRVVCRVRPLLPNETSVVTYPKSGENLGRGIVVTHNAEMYSFTFDKIFDESASQEAVFFEISEVVQSALDGYKVCVFAYGQSGSGKTYTMMGNPDDEQKGLIPRSVEQIFQTSKTLNSRGWKFVMKVSMVEIYNETIYDLLGSNRTANQAGDSSKCIRYDMSDLTTIVVSDFTEVSDHFKRAAMTRSVGSTEINEQSSRSHGVFMILISGVNERTGEQVEGILNMIDLAGSERLKRSGATGDRKKESQAINLSLTWLSNVILAISNGDSYVPFRNSKLTHLLQPYLGGDAKTLMLLTISQDISSAQETLSSLRFAAQVKSCEIGGHCRKTRVGSVQRRDGRDVSGSLQRRDGRDVSASAPRGSSKIRRTPSRVKFHPYLIGTTASRGGSSKTLSRVNHPYLISGIPEERSVQ